MPLAPEMRRALRGNTNQHSNSGIGSCAITSRGFHVDDVDGTFFSWRCQRMVWINFWHQQSRCHVKFLTLPSKFCCRRHILMCTVPMWKRLYHDLLHLMCHRGATHYAPTQCTLPDVLWCTLHAAPKWRTPQYEPHTFCFLGALHQLHFVTQDTLHWVMHFKQCTPWCTLLSAPSLHTNHCVMHSAWRLTWRTGGDVLIVMHFVTHSAGCTLWCTLHDAPYDALNIPVTHRAGRTHYEPSPNTALPFPARYTHTHTAQQAGLGWLASLTTTLYTPGLI